MNFWDERYISDDYIYGTEPNLYLKDKLNEIKPNSLILFPCEGEGRNCVYAKSLGHEILAFDSSIEGKNKAIKLAAQNNLKIDYLINDIETFEYKSNSFDCLSLIYAHFHEDLRSIVFSKFNKMLKPGAFLIIEVFNKKQINNNTGGPKDINLLFELNQTISLLSDFEILEASELEVELNEGDYHKGKSDVLRIFAKKK